MNDAAELRDAAESSRRIRVRGVVQGVGFRPAVWRLAGEYGLRGWVANDGDGVSIRVSGPADAVEGFIAALPRKAPPLARVDAIEHEPDAAVDRDAGFRIVESRATGVRTGVAPDAAACKACIAEVFDPFARRFRYPFTNCTHCGPRLSIIDAMPYDRERTTMRGFAMCSACRAEYANPADRRFHAQPIACHACGPRARLERSDGAPIAVDTLTTLDAVDAVCTLLRRGHIVAIKGLGGYQLACDGCNEAAVARLRALKRRARKPFALMARDLDVIRRYCEITEAEELLLCSPEAPIVIVAASGSGRTADSVAPGVGTLGVMLPATPLHHLILRRMERPIVLTSGNLADEPQCIDDAQARARLGGIAEYFLTHDRPIARRVDDSVVRVAGGAPRVLRRARGYAPAPMALPKGFADAPAVLAMGAELKNSFCLIVGGQAVLSHHMGDLEDALAYEDYRDSVGRYLELIEHRPGIVAVDLHPEYLSRKLGGEIAQRLGTALAEVQHHHAHVAACMAENGIALDAGPVIGVALDGLGYGADGTLWGGEFLIADYRDCRRVATFRPVALPGGEQAIHEPWRNTYAHLTAQMGWARFAMNHSDLELFRFLDSKPRALLDGMIARAVNSPAASSCGRLFDAVAAAAGVSRERALYEGQAAVEFESLVNAAAFADESEEMAYPFAIPRLKESNLPYVEPLAMWQALLGDLGLGTPVPVIAARFHKGLANIVVRMVEKVSRYESGERPVRTVALSGGVFQNRILLERVAGQLEKMEFRVLMHRRVPANDGGLSLGQAVVAAARASAS